MNMWTAIVLIVIAGIAGEAWRNYVKARRSAPSRDALDALTRRIGALDQDLRGRVETLERIVTDSKENLKREFERLDKTG